MKQFFLLLSSVLTFGVLAAACAGAKPIDVDQGDDDTATLTTNLAGLISGPWQTETCNTATGCHQGAAPAGGVILGGVTATEVHTSITTRPLVINTSNAAASTLLTDPLGTTAHTGGTVWATTDPSYQGTLIWIQQGALNN